MLIIKDVRVQPGDSAFLLDDGKTAILYDTGFGFTGFGVADNIKKHLGERPLDYIFLTHSHYDHALGSAYILRRYPDAKVVAGEYAAKIFAKPTAKAVMWDLDRKFATKCGACDYENLADELRVDIAVSDGDEISAGDMTFRVLNLPGHTKCSVGYYLAAEQLQDSKQLTYGSLSLFDFEPGQYECSTEAMTSAVIPQPNRSPASRVRFGEEEQRNEFAFARMRKGTI